MSKRTYSMDLEFFSPYPLKEGELPGGATANIAVKNVSQAEKGGLLLLTPDCVSFRQIEYQIDRLQGELQVIREEARRKFIHHDELEKQWSETYEREHPDGKHL